MGSVLYTALTGGHDLLKAQPVKPRFAFVEERQEMAGWTPWTCSQGQLGKGHDRARAKRPKALPHDYIPELGPDDVSVWIDAKITLRDENFVETMAEYVLESDADMLAFAHPDRDDLAEEVIATRHWRPFAFAGQPLEKQVEHYAENWGVPEHAGLAETAVLVRRHTDATRRFGEAWWDQMVTWNSWQDQLSFGALAWAATDPTMGHNIFGGPVKIEWLPPWNAWADVHGHERQS